MRRKEGREETVNGYANVVLFAKTHYYLPYFWSSHTVVNFSLRRVFSAMIDDKGEKTGEPGLDAGLDAIEDEQKITFAAESRATEDAEDEIAEDEASEVINSEGDLEVIDDPMAGAFDLDGGDRFESFENTEAGAAFRNKVETAKEFFNAEVLYRFDIIPPEELAPIKGDYRIELKGNEGGVWSLKVGDQLEITNVWQEADTVMIMQQRDFMEIVNGTLNPQLALLSRKIEVKGNAEKAVRFQDLLAPRID